MAGPLYAQSAVEPTDALDSDGDIVVTAQRREQRLQEVPVPITAFSAGEIARLQMDDAFDIAKYVPSTHITQSAFKATATYFIRGVGSLDISSTNDPPITIYENDLIIPRPNANNIGLFDVERIEVLRGPQGTLFGRNTSGGAVNIVLKKPAETVGGYVEGSYGSFDKARVRATIDLPINDKILTKTTGFFLNDPGFTKNITTGETVGGEHNWGIREDVRLKLSDSFTWDIGAEYSRSEGLGFSLAQVGTPAPSISAPPAPLYYQATTGIRVSDCSDPLATWSAGRGGSCSKADSLGIGSDMQWDLGAGSLQLLYGFRQYWAQYQFDSTNSPVPVYGNGGLFSDGYGYSHSAELKWTSDLWDGRVKYVAGLFYINIFDKNRLSSASYNAATGVRSYTQDIMLQTKTNSMAGYLQADIKVIEPLVLTLGGRFTHDIKRLGYIPQNQYPSSTAAGVTTSAPTISTAQVDALGRPTRLESNRFTPRAALQFNFSRDINVYASATNGFKAGGWNGRVTNANLVRVVEPEKVWAYELGLRSQFLDRKATVNLTAFQQDIEGYQNTVQTILPGDTQISTLLQNIADFRVRGVEFDLNYQFTPRLSVFASGSWLDAKYTRIVRQVGVPAANQLQPGEPPTQAPKFQISAGPTYRLPLGGDAEATISGLWRHSSTYQISILNPVRTPTDDFADFNVQVDSGARWYGSLGCTNCLNRKSYMLILRNFVYPVDPRRVTMTIGYKF
ncbi:MAG: TonB-dependent receptor [Sphingobium sp.]